jgi:HK97 family phage portal protein
MGILAKLRQTNIKAETTTLRDPATWLIDWLGGSRSSSGVQVSESVALGLSAYYCGVNMIASTIGALPLHVYQRDGKRVDIAEAHPVDFLLHDEPNPEMTAISLRQTWLMNALAHGKCYGEIVFDNRGNPVEIWPIPPDRGILRRDATGKLFLQVTLYTGEIRYLPYERVIHVPAISHDGRVGVGLIQVAMESIGLNAAQETYSGRFFRNGGNVSMTIETPNKLDDKQFARFDKIINEKFSGLDNAHRIALLEGGLKANPLNPTHEESQLIESRRFAVEDWARWLNMPVHKLKELTHATFSNIEHQNIEWVVDCILPWLVRFEQEFNRKLFRNRNMFYTKHNVDGLLRGDMKTRYEAYAVGRMWGWLSANDVLRLEDKNPLPGSIGDSYLYPANMLRADQPVAIQQAAAARLVNSEMHSLRTKGASDTYNEVFERRIQDMVGVSAETAKQYMTISSRLNLFAVGREIPDETVHAAKVATLIQLANGGQPHALP